jgi:hypothetical protein
MRVDDKDLRDVLHVLCLSADRLQCKCHGIHVGHRDEIRGHQAAGRLLVVAQQPIDVTAILDTRKNRLLLFGLELTQQVGRVVVLKLVDDLRGALRLECRKRGLGVRVFRHLDQRLRRDLRREGANQVDALFLVKGGKHVGEVGWFEL